MIMDGQPQQVYTGSNGMCTAIVPREMASSGHKNQRRDVKEHDDGDGMGRRGGGDDGV